MNKRFDADTLFPVFRMNGISFVFLLQERDNIKERQVQDHPDI